TATQQPNAIIQTGCRAAESLLGRSNPRLLQEHGTAISFQTGEYDVCARDRIIAGVELRPESAGERPVAAKIVGTDVVNRDAAHAASEFERVHVVLNLGEVAQLPTLVGIDGMADLRAAAAEGAANPQGWYGAVAPRFAAVMRILKTNFVNGRRIDHGGFSTIDGVVC